MAHGRTGAKTSTFNDYNPRELVARLMAQHPKAGTDELFKLFREALAGAFSNYQEAVDYYCFVNQFRAINDEPAPRVKLRVVQPLPAKQVEAEKAKAAASANARLADLAPVLFMKLPTPFKHAHGGNKTLGELTGKEGRKLTGGLAKFFKDIPDNKRLIDVKSEAKLRELWEKL